MANDLIDAAAKGAGSVLLDVYKDVAQPAARRVGLSLEALIKVAVSPIDLIDWGFESSKDWLKEKIEARLQRTPPDCIIQPRNNIVYSALSHVATSYDEAELRDLYAELLLKAMDSRTSTTVHPAYFSIIEQLTAQEALVLVGLRELHKEILFTENLGPYSYPFAKNRKPSVEEQFQSFCASVLTYEAEQSTVWLANLCRLNLLSLQTSAEAVFQPPEYHRDGTREAQVDNYERRSLVFTDFGRAFISACAPVP